MKEDRLGALQACAKTLRQRQERVWQELEERPCCSDLETQPQMSRDKAEEETGACTEWAFHVTTGTSVITLSIYGEAGKSTREVCLGMPDMKDALKDGAEPTVKNGCQVESPMGVGGTQGDSLQPAQRCWWLYQDSAGGQTRRGTRLREVREPVIQGSMSGA